MKSDEWPADREPTTTEAQERAITSEEVVARRSPDDRHTPDDDEIVNVDPDQLTD